MRTVLSTLLRSSYLVPCWPRLLRWMRRLSPRFAPFRRHLPDLELSARLEGWIICRQSMSRTCCARDGDTWMEPTVVIPLAAQRWWWTCFNPSTGSRADHSVDLNTQFDTTPRLALALACLTLAYTGLTLPMRLVDACAEQMLMFSHGTDHTGRMIALTRIVVGAVPVALFILATTVGVWRLRTHVDTRR
ncbi:MAG: hypothetical protein ACJATT_004815 [Myxococcota bacterium]|jgi:hypothetical protein